MDKQEQTVEIFCGADRPFSSIADFLGYKTFTFDQDPAVLADVIGPVGQVDAEKFPSAPTMVWIAPPSEGFDDKAGWENHSPVTPEATLAEQTLRDCLGLAVSLRPQWWFMEAPKSHLRKLSLMAGFNRGHPQRIRYTISPAKFGGAGKKEIDVWTNAFWWVPLGSSEAPPEGPAKSQHRRVPPSVYLDMLNQYDAYMRNKGLR